MTRLNDDPERRERSGAVAEDYHGRLFRVRCRKLGAAYTVGTHRCEEREEIGKKGISTTNILERNSLYERDGLKDSRTCAGALSRGFTPRKRCSRTICGNRGMSLNGADLSLSSFYPIVTRDSLKKCPSSTRSSALAFNC
jgi:hypothetical protein